MTEAASSSANARAALTPRALYEALASGVSGAAQRVVVGLNWTLVVGPNGAGMAHTPARGSAGCRSLPRPGTYAGQALAALAALWESDNVFERAIAFAALNAHWNRFDLAASAVNGLDLIENHGSRSVVIGRFPGLAERFPGIAVVEREPRAGEYPESELPRLLENARFVAMTASSLVNGSMAGILALCAAAFVVVIGPSTPLAPPLFEFGAGALSGFIARDVDRLAQAVSEGAAVAALRPFGRYATLLRENTR
ncbi:MAG: hypothetical protein IT531_08060 [Burkholderiales bacterium]|nr:hypothetical protein [Burkholderiales bacterium]